MECLEHLQAEPFPGGWGCHASHPSRRLRNKRNITGAEPDSNSQARICLLDVSVEMLRANACGREAAGLRVIYKQQKASE